MSKILLLGSGELGKEFVISAKRLGQYVIAVDSYSDAPAQQVADAREVIPMLDGAALDEIVDRHRPGIIVPEIEAIRTERFYDYEKRGIQVVPSARTANFTMNRKAIRNLAAETLKLKTACYAYADTLDQFKKVVSEIGIPCVVKPLMSSSGKGQSVLKDDGTVKIDTAIETAWDYAMNGTRGDFAETISMPKTDIRIFGKPTTRPYRRMAVALSYDSLDGNLAQVRTSAIESAKKVCVV